MCDVSEKDVPPRHLEILRPRRGAEAEAEWQNEATEEIITSVLPKWELLYNNVKIIPTEGLLTKYAP